MTKEKLFFNNPSQIYNVDETGMPLEHLPPKIIAKKGRRKCVAEYLATEVK